MPEPNKHKSLLKTACSQIADDLYLLAMLHDQELSPTQLIPLSGFSLSQSLSVPLRNEADRMATEELDKTLRSFSSKQDKQHQFDEIAADYAAIYLNHSYRVSPLESVWFDDENLTYQEAMFNIRECYHQFDLQVRNWRMRSDDHLVCQLQFIADVLERESLDVRTITTLSNFYDEHLFLWFDRFTEGVKTRCKTDFYSLLAHVTHAYIEAVRDFFSAITETKRPTRSEVEERIQRGKVAEPQVHELKYMPGLEQSW